MDRTQKTSEEASQATEMGAISEISPRDASRENLIDILTDQVCDRVTESLEAIQRAIERRIIIRVLRKTGGNISQASKILGIKRPTLSYKIKKLKIERD